MISQHPNRATDPARHSAATAAGNVVRTHPWWGPDHAYGCHDRRKSVAAERLADGWAAARLDGPVPGSRCGAWHALLAHSDPSQLDADLRCLGAELADLIDELEAAWPSIASARVTAEKVEPVSLCTEPPMECLTCDGFGVVPADGAVCRSCDGAGTK